MTLPQFECMYHWLPASVIEHAPLESDGVLTLREFSFKAIDPQGQSPHLRKEPPMTWSVVQYCPNCDEKWLRTIPMDEEVLEACLADPVELCPLCDHDRYSGCHPTEDELLDIEPPF